jgi:hypothetical protein
MNTLNYQYRYKYSNIENSLHISFTKNAFYKQKKEHYSHIQPQCSFYI